MGTQCIAKKYFDEKDSSVRKFAVLGLFRMHSEANRVHNGGALFQVSECS